MKKIYCLFILLAMIVIVAGFAIADDDTPVITTIISGNISNADFTQPVGGATVEVTCDVNTAEPILSNGDGSYLVIFDGNFCSEGNFLSVHAFKEGVGDNTVIGEIQDNVDVNLNLGVVNVPLVPEYGVVVGIVTAMGALGMFFYFRKK